MEGTDAVWGYCIRVDALEGYLQKVGMMMTAYNWVAGMTHKGDRKTPNPHYHFVIKTNLEDGTIRKRMKAIFDKGKGNGHMSIVKWDGKLEAVAYLFHEDADAPLTWRKNVTDEYIENARNHNKRVQVEVTKAKGNASWTLEEDVWNQICEARMDHERRFVTNRETEHGREFIKQHFHEVKLATMLFLTALRKGKYAPNDYLLKAMVTRLLFRQCDGDLGEEEDLADFHARRIYRER